MFKFLKDWHLSADLWDIVFLPCSSTRSYQPYHPASKNHLHIWECTAIASCFQHNCCEMAKFARGLAPIPIGSDETSGCTHLNAGSSSCSCPTLPALCLSGNARDGSSSCSFQTLPAYCMVLIYSQTTRVLEQIHRVRAVSDSCMRRVSVEMSAPMV